MMFWPIIVEPRPVRDGLLLVASVGRIVEGEGVPAVGDRGPACRVECPNVVWFDDVRVAAVVGTGVCREYPAAQPVGNTFAAFLAGTLTLHEFLDQNPNIQLGWEGGQWYWTTDRLRCEAGLIAPPWHIIVPGYTLRHYRTEFWAGGGCAGQPVLVRCGTGAAFTWAYTDGNRQYAACSMAVNVVVEGGTPGFSACDVNFDGVSGLEDYGLFVRAGLWDWDMDGVVGPADAAGFLGCLAP